LLAVTLPGTHTVQATYDGGCAPLSSEEGAPSIQVPSQQDRVAVLWIAV
jgi:hypothetical protein